MNGDDLHSFLDNMPDDMFPPPPVLTNAAPDDQLPYEKLPSPFDIPAHLVGDDREQYIFACYYFNVIKVQYMLAQQSFKQAQQVLIQSKQNMDSLHSDMWEAASVLKQKGKRKTREE